MTYLLGILLAISSFFLIVLVLIQQGRGGGLAGAFGGMGGQSAFGTKAGDLFTKITIGVAAVWILLCVATVKYASTQSSPFADNLGANAGATVGPSSTDAEQSDQSAPPTSTNGNAAGGSMKPAEKGDK